MTDLLALSRPFDPARISWRIGSTTGDKTKGMALAYIDSRDVQDRLDAVCGIAGWQCRYPHAGQKTVCAIGVKIDNEWIWKEDGAGDSDVEAEKGALSDAFKRAAVKWGIGRYLYDIDSPWVTIKAAGRSFAIEPSELPRLRKLLPSPANGQQTASQPIAEPIPVDQVKNAPGIAKAKVWVNAHIADMQNAGDPDLFMEILTEQKAHWSRICSTYPNLWIGPDGSGLRGEAMKMANIYEVRPLFDEFVKAVELSAASAKDK